MGVRLYDHYPVLDPNRIIIPSIDVDAVVVPVGLLANGDMETPDWGIAGWYSLGPAPGEPGPAVLLAHMDSIHGRDVFYHLKEVEPGDEVFVYGSDGGDPAVFLVDSVETILKDELPRDRIWLYSKESLIRLITCGGKYDRTWGHYLSNVIVYGHLVR
jgi:sortase (surface protein transpeptidase)